MSQDKIIVCADCGQEFAFTAGEREFYEEKGLSEPEFCLVCRGKYKARERDLERYKR